MTTASTRAVSLSSVSRLRIALLAASSATLMAALAPLASAAPNCSGDGTANTCVINLANIAAETVDAGSQPSATVDLLQFNDVAPLSLNANTIGNGTSIISPVRFLNFEAAQVTAGTVLGLTGSGTGTTSLAWSVNGSLTLSGGNAIGDASAVTLNGGLLDLNTNSETIGSLAGTGTVNLLVGSPVLTTGGNGSSTVFTGTIIGSGGLTKTGSGTMELNSDNGFTGPLNVAGGILEIGHAGAIDDASSVAISSGTLSGETAYSIKSLTITTTSALSRLTGNVTINGNVSSNGGLQPGNTAPDPVSLADNPGQEMGAITINGTYTATGASAYVGSFINLDAATAVYDPVTKINGTPGIGGTHDLLTINGNITGTQKTMYALASFEASPTGFATKDNGILAIRVTGTNSGNDFYQGSALNAGGYQYLLTYVPNYSGTDDGYFLQSAVRDELVVRPAVISAGQTLVRDCYHDNQRVPDSPKGATYGRGWIGYGRGSSTFGSDTGVNSDVNFSCTTGGMDWRMGGGWFGGVSGGFGDTDGNITTPAGVGKFTGTGRAAEVFATFTSSALFINLSAGYNAMDYTYNGALTSGLIGKTAGLIATAQTGVALDLDAIAVKLLGQLSYDGTNCSDSCFGVRAQQDSGLVEAKGSVRFDGVANEGSIRPWVALSFSDVLSNGINTATINTVSVSQDANSQLVSLDGGMQAYLDQNFALTLEGGYHESLTVDVSGYKAAVGLKMYW